MRLQKFAQISLIAGKSMLKVLLIISPLILCAIFALFVPFFSPYALGFGELVDSKLAPNVSHFFGTDLLGRDLFTQIAYALRVSLFVGFSSSLLAIIFAVIFVLIARCFFYSFFMRSLDAILAMPSLLIVLFFQSFLGGNLFVMSFVIALGHFAFIAKVLDSKLDSIMKSEFYLCAISLGSTKFRAFYNDLLPPCVNLLAILFVINIAHAISHEATISFFGLGVPLDSASLGGLLSEGARAILSGAWWLVIYPVIFLLALVLPLLGVASLLQDRFGVSID